MATRDKKPKWWMRNDQTNAVNFFFDGAGAEGGLLWADVGTGKTVIALTLIQEMKMWKKPARAIVVAPKRVCTDVWPQEVEEWMHLGSLFVEHMCDMKEEERLDMIHYFEHDVLCINYELLSWLMKIFPRGVPGYSMLIFDEIDKMKGHKTVRFKGVGRATEKGHIPGRSPMEKVLAQSHWHDGNSRIKWADGLVGAGVLRRSRGEAWDIVL